MTMISIDRYRYPAIVYDHHIYACGVQLFPANGKEKEGKRKMEKQTNKTAHTEDQFGQVFS